MLACIMKLKKLLLILLIIIVSGTFNAHSKIYKLGEKLTTNQIKIDKKITIDLTAVSYTHLTLPTKRIV